MDIVQFNDYLKLYLGVLAGGFAVCTILDFLSYGIFKAFKLLNIKKI